MENFFLNEFGQKFAQAYREGMTQPTNPENRFDKVLPSVQSQTLSQTPEDVPGQLVQSVIPEKELPVIYGLRMSDVIEGMLPNGVPEGSRHKLALKLASDMIILFDAKEDAVRSQLMALPWVREIVAERGADEIDRIIDAAKNQLHKREKENMYYPQPSREMRRAIERLAGKSYAQLVREASNRLFGCVQDEQDDVIPMLERIGAEIEKLFPHYPLLKLLCHRLPRKHYVAALFVGGAFAMTLMTRMHFRFWSEPGKKCRLNCILELIGRSGSGKSMAADLYRLMMEPVKRADQAQIDALNKWNMERDQKSGADKNKTPRPSGIFRILPAESSAAAIREAEFNAKEMIDGEETSLHVFQFNTELDDLQRQMKKGYMNIETLFLKSFANEPHGSFLKTSSSIVGEYDVHYNGVFTGTANALAKQTNPENFARGLLFRLTVVMLGDSNFEMRENHVYDEADASRDEQLRRICYDLDSTKGEIPFLPVSNALHNWTERRMADARDEQSKALEDLVKRPCWHAAHYVAPFIVNRHWDKMVEDNGRFKCGPDFALDKTDEKLALLIANAHFAFQRMLFLGVGEKLYDDQLTEQVSKTHHQQRTLMAYRRLPTVFTSEDVNREYGYNSVGSVCSRLKHLQDDGLAVKIRKGEDKGKYRKLL